MPEPAADLLTLVRREASRRSSPSKLAAAVRPLSGGWKSAEQAIAAEFGASPRAARRLVDAFERVARAVGGAEPLGRAARLRASFLTWRSGYPASRAAYQLAIRLLDGAARDGARVGLAAVEMRLGRFAAARALCRAVRRDARARGDALLVAAADLNEAVSLHEAGRAAASLTLYVRAEDAFSAAGSATHAARAAMGRANALVLLDRYDEAAALFDAAVGRFDAAGLRFDAARCRANRGALLVATERLGDADAALREAEAAYRSLGDSVHAALARVDRGEGLLRAGAFAEAARVLASARRGLGSRVPPVERFRASLLAARAALALGDAAEARRLAGPPAPSRIDGAAAARDEVLGRASGLSGAPTPARRRLEAAARAFGASRPAPRARCLAAAGWCALAAGDVAAARRLARSAARIARPLGVAGLDFAASAVSFLAEDRAGRRAAAARALESSIGALEAVRAGLGPDAMRAALLAGREEWLARGVRHALAESPAAALRFVERFRARALVDLLGDAGAAAPRDDRVAALRARVAQLERAAEGAPAGSLLRSAAAVRVRPGALRAAERALADAETARAPAPLRAAADLDALRRGLPDGTLVLSLFADDRDVVVFAADRDGVRAAAAAGGASRVAPLVEDLRYTLGKFALGGGYAERHGARLAREVEERLADLASLVLAPVAEPLRAARRVIVVPHGAWHSVPFAALPFEGRPLVERADVVLTPAFGALAPNVPSASGPPLVLAAADEAAPSIAREAAAVDAALRGAIVRAGGGATAAALAAAAAPRLVHIAAHGRHRPDAPALGGVRLADGWLRAAELASFRLPGALVVLSGCETGLASVGPADEVHGLVRGVFASGAADLVATLWRVGDEATADLMTRFHAGLAAGRSPEGALADAQREAVARGLPVWAWAGFAAWTRRLAPAGDGSVAVPSG